MTTLSLHHELLNSLHPHPNTTAEIAAARRLAAAHALDINDERDLLELMGVAS